MDWTSVREETQLKGLPPFYCRKCDSDDIDYYIHESSDGAHEDYKYRCNACKRRWVVEGSDY